MNPKKKVIMLWEILICLAYLICYFMDPFIYSYR